MICGGTLCILGIVLRFAWKLVKMEFANLPKQAFYQPPIQHLEYEVPGILESHSYNVATYWRGRYNGTHSQWSGPTVVKSPRRRMACEQARRVAH